MFNNKQYSIKKALIQIIKIVQEKMTGGIKKFFPLKSFLCHLYNL